MSPQGCIQQGQFIECYVCPRTVCICSDDVDDVTEEEYAMNSQEIG